MRQPFWHALAVLFLASFPAVASAQTLDEVLEAENAERGVTQSPLPAVDDLAYLRRVYADLIGRIPTAAEIREYESWPAGERRERIVDQLLQEERFADRWTVFFADMLRLRSNAEGGAATMAWVHQSIEEGVPYDRMAHRLIAASGKAGNTPEIGFILGDNADPMALAGATAQTFLGLRVACAQCHDHPFDKWTREDFYGLAAFFGKTRRVESDFTNTVYTREVAQSSVLWPPEGAIGDDERKPMIPTFLYELAEEERPSRPVARLQKLRREQARLAAKEAAEASSDEGSSIDALLADAARKAREGERKPELLDVAEEAKREAERLNVSTGGFKRSELRTELARLVTDPYNRYFSRSFVNRVWAHLVGRGFVEPVDDFSDSNPPSHPRTLDFLADEFVANGFDLRYLVRTIVLSDAYQRQHAVGLDEAAQAELERAFLATPTRRMLSEVLYDSIVTAGHLFDVKHEAGANLQVVWRAQRVMKEREDAQSEGEESLKPVELATGDGKPAMKKPGRKMARAGEGSPYDVERAIELDFESLLSKQDEAVQVDEMRVMSKEEIEAMRMQQQMRRRQPDAEYYDRFVKVTIDDNPQFNTALRMASPAPPEHFLRIFGQTDRNELGETREQTPSMRQALMLMNGRLVHEASRVGALEPVHELLAGENADLDAAVRLAYREVLTREPAEHELAEARQIVASGESPLAGMADLRWVLLNCNEFRFLP